MRYAVFFWAMLFGPLVGCQPSGEQTLAAGPDPTIAEPRQGSATHVGEAGEDAFLRLLDRVAERQAAGNADLRRLEFALLLHAGKKEAAEKLYEKHVSAWKTDLHVRLGTTLGLGYAYQPLSQSDKGIPRDGGPRPPYEFGMGRSERRHWGEALAWFQYTLRLDPFYTPAQYSLTRVKHVKYWRSRVEAEDAAAVLLLARPGSPLAKNTAQMINSSFDRFKRPKPGEAPDSPAADPSPEVSFAQVAKRIAANEEGLSGPTTRLQFALLIHMGKPEQAEAFYKKHLAEEEHEPALQLALARLAGRKDPSESVGPLKKLLEAHPENPQILCELAAIKIKQGDPDGATALFKQALATDVFRAVGHYQLAVLAMQSRRIDEGLEHATNVLLVEKPGSDLANDAARLVEKHVLNGEIVPDEPDQPAPKIRGQ